MLETFLTSYDPSDLPGNSVDPLGFDRGYLALADQILPGLTNVANQPRYFGLLCAGVHLGAKASASNPRELVRQRKDVLLRTERFWALANVLARGEANSGGVRGVRYAAYHARGLRPAGAARVDAEFRLLSRQAQSGGLGIYGSVAEGMRFLDRETFTLSADLGGPIAAAFIQETGMPRSLRLAIKRKGHVTERVLREWGERAHAHNAPGPQEAECLMGATHLHPVRSRMLQLLRRWPFNIGDRDELKRLRRIEKELRREEQEPELRAAIRAILRFEACYRSAQLALERLLWLCRHSTKAALNRSDLAADPVIERVRAELPKEARRFAECIAVPSLAPARLRLDDAQRFIARAAAAAGETEGFIQAIVQRHIDVQRGKFDRGRRKMPWLDRSGDRLVLSTTRAGGLPFEATAPADIPPHPYRLNAADALNRAAHGE